MYGFFLSCFDEQRYLSPITHAEKHPKSAQGKLFFWGIGFWHFAVCYKATWEKAKPLFLLFLQVADMALLNGGLSRFHMGIFNAIFMQNRCGLMISVTALNMGSI